MKQTCSSVFKSKQKVRHVAGKRDLEHHIMHEIADPLTNLLRSHHRGRHENTSVREPMGGGAGYHAPHAAEQVHPREGESEC